MSLHPLPYSLPHDPSDLTSLIQSCPPIKNVSASFYSLKRLYFSQLDSHT